MSQVLECHGSNEYKVERYYNYGKLFKWLMYQRIDPHIVQSPTLLRIMGSWIDLELYSTIAKLLLPATFRLYTTLATFFRQCTKTFAILL